MLLLGQSAAKKSEGDKDQSSSNQDPIKPQSSSNQDATKIQLKILAATFSLLACADRFCVLQLDAAPLYIVSTWDGLALNDSVRTCPTRRSRT
jgi:hypothetical protein